MRRIKLILIVCFFMAGAFPAMAQVENIDPTSGGGPGGHTCYACAGIGYANGAVDMFCGSPGSDVGHQYCDIYNEGDHCCCQTYGDACCVN